MDIGIKKRGIVLAIIAGMALVAAAMFFQSQATATTEVITLQRPVDNLVYGNKNAQTTIVEFSDVECPFCARLHTTLKEIVDESAGTINWEYRHLPIPNHLNAELGAVAIECVVALADNSSAWKFMDAVFGNQRILSKQFYIQAAVEQGLSAADFEVCLQTDAHMETVRLDLAAARSAGANSTPHSVIIYPDGTTKAITGALPKEVWQEALSK